MGCPMGYGQGSQRPWGGGMMHSFRGDDGGRMMMVHLWPMVFFAWMLFMLGVMVGTKRSMMMQRMRMMGGMGGAGHMGMGGMGSMGMGKMGGMGMCGPGMMHHHHGGMMHYHGEGMKAHHHHGEDEAPCRCEKQEGGSAEPTEGASPS